jgi:hypothetical protein
MKKDLYLIVILPLFITLGACGQGFVTTNPPPGPTYQFTDFTSDAVNGTTNCNLTVTPFVCNKESSTITMFVDFATSTPLAYLQIPTTTELPIGTNLTSTPGCTNQSGNDYSCTITVKANNVAESSTISIPFFGSLGEQTMFNIIYK